MRKTHAMMHAMRGGRMAFAVALGAACACKPSAPAAAADPCPGATAPRPGLAVERFSGRDGCVTLVRIDPARFRLRLLTALVEGGSRTAPEWAHEFGLTGLINASMFAPDQRSIGLL